VLVNVGDGGGDIGEGLAELAGELETFFHGAGLSLNGGLGLGLLDASTKPGT
jgi:hypothetical protein